MQVEAKKGFRDSAISKLPDRDLELFVSKVLIRRCGLKGR